MSFLRLFVCRPSVRLLSPSLDRRGTPHTLTPHTVAGSSSRDRGERGGRTLSARQKFQSPMMCCMVIHDLQNYGTPWAKMVKVQS